MGPYESFPSLDSSLSVNSTSPFKDEHFFRTILFKS